MSFSKRQILALALAASLMTSSAYAGGLLGSVLSGGDSSSSDSILGVVGGSDSDSLATIGGGDAGDNGLVNVGLGGDDGQLVDANIGGHEPLATANVSLGGSGGLVDVDAGIGDVLDASVNVGGDNHDTGGPVEVDVDLDLGGTPGHGGGHPGNGGAVVNTVNGGDTTTIIQFANRGGGHGGNTGPAGSGKSCNGASANQLIGLFQQTQPGDWSRASGVEVVPLRVCASLRGQVADWLRQNNTYRRMIGAVAGDRLITGGLSQTRYQPGHVLGVARQVNVLMVYVF